MPFPHKLRAARLLAGLTQRELGAAVAVGATAVSAWEVGRTEPSIATLRALAEALSVPVALLVDDPIGSDE